MHQSIPAVPIPTPRATVGHLLTLSVPGGGSFAILSRPGGWAFANPRAFGSRVFESAMEEFIDRDKVLAEDWLVCQELDKLVDVSNCMFSQF